MITIRHVKKEARVRDAKRARAILKISSKAFHLTRKEVLSLYMQADRFLMDTARIPEAKPTIRRKR